MAKSTTPKAVKEKAPAKPKAAHKPSAKKEVVSKKLPEPSGAPLDVTAEAPQIPNSDGITTSPDVPNPAADEIQLAGEEPKIPEGSPENSDIPVAPQEPTPGEVLDPIEEPIAEPAVDTQPIVTNHDDHHPRDEQRIGVGYANGTRQSTV